MQWEKADNENTTKQKTDQAKCEKTWICSFKNQRQRWCKLGKALPLAILVVQKSFVQNQNKTNKHMRIPIRRKILEKLIWINQTVLAWWSSAMGSSRLPSCRKKSGLAGERWISKSDNPGLSQDTQDLEAWNFRLLRGLCYRYSSADEASRLPGELLPCCQTGNIGTSAVSQNLADRNQTPMHLYETWQMDIFWWGKKMVWLISNQNLSLISFISFWPEYCCSRKQECEKGCGDIGCCSSLFPDCDNYLTAFSYAMKR